MSEITITPFFAKADEVIQRTIFTAESQTVESLVVTLGTTSYGTGCAKTLADFEDEYGLRVSSITPDKNTIVFISGEYAHPTDASADHFACNVTAKFSGIADSVTCWGYLYKGTMFAIRYLDENGDSDPQAYSVAFSSNSDEVSKILDVGYSDYRAPTGYTLVGWNTDAEATEPQTKLSVPADKILDMYPILKAVEVVQEYTLTYQNKAGVVKSEKLSGVTVTGTIKGAGTLGFTDPEGRKNFRFEGWSNIQDGEVVYTEGDEITLNGNVTLYAIWVFDKSYATFVFSTGDSNVVATLSPLEMDTLGEEYVVTLPTPERTGYVLKGWMLGETLYENQPLIVVCGIDDQEFTFSAVWTPMVTIHLTAHEYKGKESFGSTSASGVGEASVNYPLRKLSRQGYEQIGWTVEATASGKTVTESLGMAESMFSRTVSESTEFVIYGVWAEYITYTVKYHLQDGTIRESRETSISTTLEFKALGDPGVFNVGFSHIGWKTEDTVPKTYSEGDTITLTSASRTIDLYQNWSSEGWTQMAEVVVPVGIAEIKTAFNIETSKRINNQTRPLVDIVPRLPAGINSASVDMLTGNVNIVYNIPSDMILPETAYLVINATYRIGDNASTEYVHHYYSQVRYNTTKTVHTLRYQSGGATHDITVETYASSHTFQVSSLGTIYDLSGSDAFTVPDGKSFAGWRVNGEGTTYNAGDSITVSGTTVLLPFWANKGTYRIKFLASYTEGGKTYSGKMFNEPAPVLDVDGDEVSGVRLVLDVPVLEMYSFKDWTVENTGNVVHPGEYIPPTYFTSVDGIKTVILKANYEQNYSGVTTLDDVYLKCGEACNVVLTYDVGIAGSSYYWWVGENRVNLFQAGHTEGATDFNLSGASKDGLDGDSPIPGIALVGDRASVVKLSEYEYYGVSYITGRPTKVGRYPVYLLHTTSDLGVSAVQLYLFHIIVYDPMDDAQTVYSLHYNLNSGSYPWTASDFYGGQDLEEGSVEANHQMMVALPAGMEWNKLPDVISQRPPVLTESFTTANTAHHFTVKDVFSGRRKSDESLAIEADDKVGTVDITLYESIIGWSTVPNPTDNNAVLNIGDTVICSVEGSRSRSIYARWGFRTELYLEYFNPDSKTTLYTTQENLILRMGITPNTPANPSTETCKYAQVDDIIGVVHEFGLPMKGLAANGYTFIGWYDINDPNPDDPVVYKEVYPVLLTGEIHILRAYWVSTRFTVNYDVSPATVTIPVAPKSNTTSDGKVRLIDSQGRSCILRAFNGTRWLTTPTELFQDSEAVQTSTISLQKFQLSYYTDNGEESLQMDVLPMDLFNEYQMSEYLGGEVPTLLVNGLHYDHPAWCIKDSTGNPTQMFAPISESDMPLADDQKELISFGKTLRYGRDSFGTESTFGDNALVLYSTRREGEHTVSIEVNQISTGLNEKGEIVAESTPTNVTNLGIGNTVDITLPMSSSNRVSTAEDGEGGLEDIYRNEYHQVGWAIKTVANTGQYPAWNDYGYYASDLDGFTISYGGKDYPSMAIFPLGGNVAVHLYDSRVEGRDETVPSAPEDVIETSGGNIRLYNEVWYDLNPNATSRDVLIPVWGRERTITAIVRVDLVNAVVDREPLFVTYPFVSDGTPVGTVSLNFPVQEREVDGVDADGNATKSVQYYAVVNLPSQIGQVLKSSTITYLNNTYPADTAYRFAGWYEDDPDSTIQYEQEVILKNVESIVDGNGVTHKGKIVRYTASFVKSSPVLVRYYDENTLFTVSTGYVFENDEGEVEETHATITSAVPTRDKATFGGWSRKESQTIYKAGSSLIVTDGDWDESREIYVVELIANFGSTEDCKLIRYSLVDGRPVASEILYLENIQSLQKTQNSPLNTNAIMTQDSSKSIVLDTSGVGGTYTVKFLRVHPDDYQDWEYEMDGDNPVLDGNGRPVLARDEAGHRIPVKDSRKWSTARWRQYWAEFADRWCNSSEFRDSTGEWTGGFTFEYTPPAEYADYYPPIRENVFIQSLSDVEYGKRYVEGNITLVMGSMKPRGYDPMPSPASGKRTVIYINHTCDSKSEVDVLLQRARAKAVSSIEFAPLRIGEQDLAVISDIPSNWGEDSEPAEQWCYFNPAGTLIRCNPYNFINLGTENEDRIYGYEIDSVTYFPVFIVVERPIYATVLMNGNGLNSTDDWSSAQIDAGALYTDNGVLSFDAILVGGGCGGFVADNDEGNWFNQAIRCASAGELVYVPRTAINQNTKMNITIGGAGNQGDIHGGILDRHFNWPSNGHDTVLTVDGDPIATAKGGEVAGFDSTPIVNENGDIIPDSYFHNQEGSAQVRRQWLVRNLASRNDCGNRFGYGMGGVAYRNGGDGDNHLSMNAVLGNPALGTGDGSGRPFEKGLTFKKMGEFGFAEDFTGYFKGLGPDSQMSQYGHLPIGNVAVQDDEPGSASGGEASALSMRLKCSNGLIHSNIWDFTEEIRKHYYTYLHPDTRNTMISMNVPAESSPGSRRSNEVACDIPLMSIGGTALSQNNNDPGKTHSSGTPVWTDRGVSPNGLQYISKPLDILPENPRGFVLADSVYSSGILGGGGGANEYFRGGDLGIGNTLNTKGGKGGAGLIIIRWWLH